jgi:hypothetical protein
VDPRRSAGWLGGDWGGEMSFGSRFGGAELAIIGRLTERRFNLSHSDARILLTAVETTACEATELPRLHG